MDVHAVHKHSHTYTQVTPGPFPGHELFTYVLPSAHVQLHVSMFWLEKNGKNILRGRSWLGSLLISWERAKTLFCFEIWVRSSRSPGASRMTACWQHDSPAIKSECDRQVHQRLGNLVELRGKLFTSQVRRASCTFPRSIAGLFDPGWQVDPFAVPKRPTSIWRQGGIFVQWESGKKNLHL